MCDTFAVVDRGRVIFGKNSDRRVNEPHLMVRVPRKDHQEGATVKTTYVTAPQARQTYEAMLFKPSWIWGAEMGCNEFGLCIGNEAVFSKEPAAPESLIGMDYVRLALERCENAYEGLMFIADYLNKYGQGGNCAFEGNASYHNSYILADPNEAYVMETAGIYWAAKKIHSSYSISNCFSIGRQFDFSHPHLIKNAIEKGWCRGEGDFDFSRCYGDWDFMYSIGGLERRGILESAIAGLPGAMTVDSAKGILRLHTPDCERRLFACSGRHNICTHGGNTNLNQTTGSFVAELGTANRYWATGASLPCVSAYLPVCFGADSTVCGEDETDKALAFWKDREVIRRAAALGIVDHRDLQSEARRLETCFMSLEGTDADISKEAFRLEAESTDQRLENLDLSAFSGRRGETNEFLAFWYDVNSRLGIK